MRSLRAVNEAFFAVVIGGTLLFLFLLFLSLVLLVLYLLSWLIEYEFNLNRWLVFFGTIITLIVVLNVRERKQLKRLAMGRVQVSQDPSVELKTYNVDFTEPENPEVFYPIVDALEGFDYVIRFNMFDDRIEKLGLVDKCEKLGSEWWMARSHIIGRDLSLILASLWTDQTFSLFINVAGNKIDPMLFYENSHPNKLGFPDGGKGVSQAMHLATLPEADVVLVNTYCTEEMDIVYKPDTAFPVSDFVQVVINQLVPEEDRPRVIVPLDI